MTDCLRWRVVVTAVPRCVTPPITNGTSSALKAKAFCAADATASCVHQNDLALYQEEIRGNSTCRTRPKFLNCNRYLVQ